MEVCRKQVEIALSDSEHKLYNHLSTIAPDKIRNILVSFSNKKTYTVLFTSRLGCNFFCFASVLPTNFPLNSQPEITVMVALSSESKDLQLILSLDSIHLPLVGIWFGKIRERTLVWYQSPPVETNSLIQLTSEGHLVVTYSNGSVAHNIDNGDSATSAYMQDNANFVMKDSNLRVVWESFSSPSNTILLGQTLKAGQILYSKGKESSNYSIGNFLLGLQNDGNLVLRAYQISMVISWYVSTITSQDVSLVYNVTSALLYLVSDGSNVYHLTKSTPTPVEDYYHRATIDENGNFQQFTYHKRNGSKWSRVWRAIDDPCRVEAVCGVFGLCTSPDKSTVTAFHVREAITSYIPFDQEDVSKGCHPETVINYCAGPSMMNFKLQVIDDTDLQFYPDFARINDVYLEGCKKTVMDDCNIIAATFNASTSTCAKKRIPLLNARKSSSSKGQKALVKVPNSLESRTLQDSKKKHFNVRLFLKVMIAVSATLACLCGALAVYYHPLGQRLMQFTFQELHEATNGFSKILGKGSSRKVYHGTLTIDNAELGIAVKKLEKKIEKSEKEFMTELKIIGRTHHKNLVRLLGFCNENNHRLLVYEFMPNGALSSLLFAQGERPSWSQRVDMALGIARGLLYLHKECENQIIHCDIKPQNVLLDANHIAKISDFGLSKLLNKDQTKTSTNFRGTIGYIAPEWLRSAPITSKVDIFSFGVMLLEVTCCRRRIETSHDDEKGSEDEDLVLSNWVLRCMVSRNLELLVEHDSEALNDLKSFEEMVLVGLWCVHPEIKLLDLQ
ncbi:hypothetical protein Lal_00013972 [Lupinus albus]|nr:hypothetical protein Lal_00013972 [Lupinus albus]